MKKLISLTLLGLLVFALAATCYAASSRKGKRIYNKVCRSCHIRGGEGGRMAPSDKTIAQWQRFVEKNQHKAYPEIIDRLEQPEQQNLIKFLQDYAADAESAETCG